MMEGWGKRLAYRLRSSMTCDGKRVYSVFSCADDVEHKRHRRNPFHDKYLQAVLSTFETIGEIDGHGCISRYDVEAASTNVHVRTELIKSMKENLAKSTSEAVKHHKGGMRRRDMKRSMKNSSEGFPITSTFSAANSKCFGAAAACYSVWFVSFADTMDDCEYQGDMFHCHELYDLYHLRFGNYYQDIRSKIRKYCDLTSYSGGQKRSYENFSLSLGLNESVTLLEGLVKENTNFLENAQLCIDFDKEITESFDTIVRSEPAETLLSDADLNGEADISIFHKHIKAVTKELVLDDCLSEIEDEEVNLGLQNGNDSNSLLENLPAEDGEISRSSTYPRHEHSANHKFKTTEFDEQKLPQEFKKREKFSYESKAVGSLEDADSIEEFIDESSQLCTKNIKNISNDKGEVKDSASSFDATESLDSNTDDIQENFQWTGIQESVILKETKTSEKMVIELKSEEIMRFYNAKLKQRTKKAQWLVPDMEKLLESNEYIDSISNIDIIKESRHRKIEVNPDMFSSSLSRPSMNIIEYYKQLEGDPMKISGSLHFKSIDGDEDCEPSDPDKDFPKQTNVEQHQSAIDCRSDLYKSAVSWDSSLCSHNSNFTCPNIIDKSLGTITSDCVQANHDLLCNAIKAGGISGQSPNKPECWSSTQDDFEPAVTGISTESVISNSHSCVPQNKDCLPTNSLNDDELSMPVPSHNDEGFDVFDGLKNLNGDSTYGKEKTANIQKHSSPRGCLLNLKTDSVIECEIVSDNNVVKSPEGIESNNADSESYSLNGIALPLCSQKLMQNESHGQDNHKQNDRKRQHINDLIVDMVMAECQNHQHVWNHFDLVPLSLSLANGIALIHANEGMSSINFEQLLPALDNDLKSSRDGALTMQRCYMALLSLAHQQNNGAFKGPLDRALQIYLRPSSGFTLKDIVIDFETFPDS